MKRLFFHYGMPKAASTTIQEILTQNQDALGHGGITIPDLGRAKDIVQHRRLADRLAEDRDIMLPRLVEMFKKSNGDLLISSECFYYRSHSLATDVITAAKKSGFKVHAMVVLREQASHAASSYSEILGNMKMCQTRDKFFETCLTAERYDYKKFVWDYLESHADQVHLTSLARLKRNGIIPWLKECTGVEFSETKEEPLRARMSRESAFVLEMISRFRRDGARRRAVSTALGKLQMKHDWHVAFNPLPEDQYMRIYQASLPSNRELMKVVKGDLDEWFPCEPKPLSVFDPGNVTAQERRNVFHALQQVHEVARKADEESAA
jgi:hypothetical protein